MADIDGILERLVTDQGFRAQLTADPATALAGYDLSADDLALLASSMDEGDTGQRGVEQRTSKSAVVGLLASLTGGGGGHGGGKAQASDIFAKTGGTDQGNLVAPPGGGNAPAGSYAPPGGGNMPSGGGSAQASDIFAKLGDHNEGNLVAPGGGDPAQAAVDMFSPDAIKMGNLVPSDPFSPVDGHSGTAAIGDIKGVGGSGPTMDAPNMKIAPAEDLSPEKVLGNLAPPAAPATAEYPTGGGFLSGTPDAQAPSVSETAGDGSKGVLIGLNQDAAVNGDGVPADAAGIQPWNGDSAKGIDIPAMKAGDTLNGDASSPAELIGLLQPPTGESAKGIGVPTIKLGESVDAFLEIDDA